MDTIVGWLAGYIAAFIGAAGYFGVAVCMALESCNVPVPSELILPFGGYLASTGRFDLVHVVLAGTLGQTAGSLVSYYIGRYAMDSRLLFWVSRSKKERLHNWFERHGESTAFFSRLLPGIRTFISLPAGAARMNVVKFTLYSTAGCLIWSSILAYMGFVAGQNWRELEVYFEYLDGAVLFGIVVVGSIYITRWFRNRRQARQILEEKTNHEQQAGRAQQRY